VPIALIEATVPRRASTPWLGNWGLAVTVALYLLGAAAGTAMGFRTDHYLASPAQFATSAAVVVLLVVVAFRLPRSANAVTASLQSAVEEGAGGFNPLETTQNQAAFGPGSASRPQSVPSPLLFGFIALAAGSAILTIPKNWGWWAAALILGLELGVAALVLIFSRRQGWKPTHKLALAAGAALSYAWHAFIEPPVIGGTGLDVRIGNAIFALAAVLLIAFAARRLRAAGQPKAA
jgi:hypothetical protein